MDSATEKKLIARFKILRWQLLLWIRDALWSIGSWKNARLDAYLEEISPDLIFLPVYYSSYMNNLASYVYERLQVPMVGYISDDCYTLKQFSLSPLFWIDRLIKRRYVRRSIDKCRVLYTITEKQQTEYNSIFGNKCRVLFKGGDFSDFSHRKTALNSPLKFVYTGNIGSGRWKTLALIGDAIAQTKTGAALWVYSQTPLSERARKRLLRNGAVKFMGPVPASQVKALQRDADILVHVESFELNERYSARLSFSTKIVDYLEAGRCILAVGWQETGAIEYLAEHDGAIVVTDRNLILPVITDLVGSPDKILEYGDKGFRLGTKFHRFELIRTDLQNSLEEVIRDAPSDR